MGIWIGLVMAIRGSLPWKWYCTYCTSTGDYLNVQMIYDVSKSLFSVRDHKLNILLYHHQLEYILNYLFHPMIIMLPIISYFRFQLLQYFQQPFRILMNLEFRLYTVYKDYAAINDLDNRLFQTCLFRSMTRRSIIHLFCQLFRAGFQE